MEEKIEERCCPICYDHFDDIDYIVLRTCEHKVCIVCASRLGIVGKQLICPLDRSKISYVTIMNGKTNEIIDSKSTVLFIKNLYIESLPKKIIKLQKLIKGLFINLLNYHEKRQSSRKFVLSYAKDITLLVNKVTKRKPVPKKKNKSFDRSKTWSVRS